ncbi:LacI family DNA-binding transcriptional regulator [Schaalia sp. Marseille-Q2122]|uniref:LacI family DNA-binding transcriptional regulator n=1 Tax=Schaalia sp. Marseille-Q2122 TaxID=2736604 RepID=UPI00158ED5E2|nr:LacI family DNA-binding transcriptional regulator [Schaalia sp. Marseille-Q2122]
MSTPRERPKRVSLADVARLAGVSPNTVSRVVRGDGEVADSTRRRISEIIDEVGYRPNYAARALAGKKTGVLHVILAAPMFHGHGQTLLSVMNEAGGADYTVSVANAYMGAGRIDHGAPPFQVDGVIILGGQQPTVELAMEMATHTPTVLLLANETNLPGVSTVSVDNAHGTEVATRHLCETGVRTLVHLAGPDSWSDADRRREGFVTACEAAGVAYDIVTSPSWNAEDGHRAVKTLGVLPDGFVAANDQLALGAMRALHERGVAIPQEVKIVGFDDNDGAECYLPPLTTIRQRFDLVGRAAINQMASLLDGEGPTDVLIEPELVIRNSSLV